jgi:hypothetical protein
MLSYSIITASKRGEREAKYEGTYSETYKLLKPPVGTLQ